MVLVPIDPAVVEAAELKEIQKDEVKAKTDEAKNLLKVRKERVVALNGLCDEFEALEAAQIAAKNELCQLGFAKRDSDVVQVYVQSTCLSYCKFSKFNQWRNYFIFHIAPPCQYTTITATQMSRVMNQALIALFSCMENPGARLLQFSGLIFLLEGHGQCDSTFAQSE